MAAPPRTHGCRLHRLAAALADLVDVDYNIKEGLPGQFGGGIGYSEAQKFSINGKYTLPVDEFLAHLQRKR